MDLVIPEGTVILCEGEVNLDLYKLIQGNCEVYTGYGTENESIQGIISKGAFFGEIGFFAKKPAIYTVVAYSDVVIQRIIPGEFETYVKEHYEEVMAIIKNMTDIVYRQRANMDLMLRETQGIRKEKISEADSNAYLRDQFKKYNLMGMRSLSFFTAKA